MVAGAAMAAAAAMQREPVRLAFVAIRPITTLAVWLRRLRRRSLTAGDE